MLIMSWNVAGLSTTVNRIHESYNPATTTSSSSSINTTTSKRDPASAALQEYIRRHGADILCLQEHKIPLSQLSDRSEPRGCSTVEGYESFWSCCVDKNKKGLNGVVTYAKKGTVLSANAAPLGSQDLDGQGRCVMTDHGSFVLFNVYVPASGGQPISYKMKFLQALRRAMQQQRQRKPVMLVGDLNITSTALDIFWKDRVVHVQDILDQVASGSNGLPQWKQELAQSWPKIVAAMETKDVVSTQTTNTLTREKFEKFRLCVNLDNRRVYLGKHETSPDLCSHYYDFDTYHYVDPDTNEACVTLEANVVSLGVLTELMAKIAGVAWDHPTQHLIARTDAGIRRVKPARQWLQCVMEQDGMVDTFRHFYPTAEARFTCWNQFTNRRYENEGARIDYILVDACLLHHVQKGDVSTLQCVSSNEDPLGENAALCAATANGAFKPVSFEGEGIVAPSQHALDTQFCTPHTGIVYTPPSFSDHVGVSLLVDDACCPRDLTLNDQDSATRKAQPHRAQTSIASFFSQPAGGRTQSSGSSTRRFANCAKVVSEPKKGMKSFFAPREPIDEPQGNGISKRPKLAPNNYRPKVTTGKKKPSILDHFRKW